MKLILPNQSASHPPNFIKTESEPLFRAETDHRGRRFIIDVTVERVAVFSFAAYGIFGAGRNRPLADPKQATVTMV